MKNASSWRDAQTPQDGPEHLEGVIEATDLLNDFNRLLADKPRTLDTVITATSLLLANALRQIGGNHGQERARHIAQTLQAMVRTTGMGEREVYHELLWQKEKHQSHCRASGGFTCSCVKTPSVSDSFVGGQ